MSDDASDSGDCDPSPFRSDGSDDGGRSLQEVLETVANPRSRYVLAHLESVSVDAVELDDLVDHVVAQETEGDAESSEDREDHRQRVAVALHHNRLPKLDDAAVLDYDPRSRTVRYWGDDRIAAVLDELETDS